MNEFELRLLRVLHALLETGSVKHAASRLAVSPSAVSHSLRALRARFSDPLFVRVGGSLQPTPLAQALRPALQSGLNALAGVLNQTVEFDPEDSRRTFSLVCADLPLITAMPRLIGTARRLWPHLDFRISGVRSGLQADLASGRLDLVLAGAEMEGRLALDDELMRSRIISEPLVSVVAAHHPLGEKSLWTLEDFLAFPHVLVSTAGLGEGLVDSALRAVGRTRRVVVTVPNFSAAGMFVANSDMIATVPVSMARRGVERLGLKVVDVPLEFERAEAYMWWHPRFHHDPAHAWWRNQLMDAFANYRQ
ncbi:LysR family transcriptional regulator [Sphingomonas sp. NFR15]|uniref:LysR family transcriptional regulator n=1 Tax=Sphingomonas sp. NFR15 TaxID=1566282 RepID=UPI00088AFD4B|nr:LysR family transcriptional regulator [Sphingomonas sp. NFR15]SDA24815.1 transcriptional regulator, LysR family [Sphingomonas sp. NFR15]